MHIINSPGKLIFKQQILLMKIKKDNKMFHVKHFVILF